jgi:hypothetical protein
MASSVDAMVELTLHGPYESADPRAAHWLLATAVGRLNADRPVIQASQ